MSKCSYILGLILVLLCLAAMWVMFGRSATEAYQNLEVGAAYQELIEIAGTPSYVTDGTRWVEPQYLKGQEQLIPNCTKELWYEHWLFPSKYSFCFDSLGVLLEKYHWQSWLPS